MPQPPFSRIAHDVKLGENVQIHAFVNLYGCSIGDKSKLGTFVEIQKGVEIGSSVKISSHSFICEGVTIEDNVFIGMNCLILKGLTIGKGSMVGAGSVVTMDVPSDVIVAGNPARLIRKLRPKKMPLSL